MPGRSHRGRVTPDPSAEVCGVTRPIDIEAVMKTKTKIAVSVRCRQRPMTARRNTDQSTDSLAVYIDRIDADL